jgi:cytochrome c553
MRNIDKGCGNRPQSPRWGHALLLLASAALLAGAGRVARADEADADTKAYARYVAMTVCGTCHGVTGNSTMPKFPRLAAQKASYLVTQLKAFRSQTRGDPDAIAYMWGMASQLDDRRITALAGYYTIQTPEVSVAGDRAAVARGRESARAICPEAARLVPEQHARHGHHARRRPEPAVAGDAGRCRIPGSATLRARPCAASVAFSSPSKICGSALVRPARPY